MKGGMRHQNMRYWQQLRGLQFLSASQALTSGILIQVLQTTSHLTKTSSRHSADSRNQSTSKRHKEKRLEQALERLRLQYSAKTITRTNYDSTTSSTLPI